MSTLEIYTDDIIKWAEQYSGQKFQAMLSDPPYALISINKRFGKKGSAPAKFGTDGRFNCLSKGFMGEAWDGFASLAEYQAWVTEWATHLRSLLHPGAVAMFYGGPRTWHRLACGLEDGGFEIYDTIMWIYFQGFPKSHKITETHHTALKPAWEPVIMCRAPREGHTYLSIMTKYGTGGLNVEGSRIPSKEQYAINRFVDGAKPWGDGAGADYTSHSGDARWPANVVCEWPTKYFYCPKPNKKEKGEYNIHPTVKPIKLNEYLARLMLPPLDCSPRRLLVPFSGSGSECIGGADAGWEEIVGVDSSKEYNEIAYRRWEEWNGGS